MTQRKPETHPACQPRSRAPVCPVPSSPGERPSMDMKLAGVGQGRGACEAAAQNLLLTVSPDPVFGV